MKLAGAYVNDDTYEKLCLLARANNRTLAGECRHIYDRALRRTLDVPNAPPQIITPPKRSSKKGKPNTP